MTDRRCNLCKGPLDLPDDPLTVDCGGDCRYCMVVIALDPQETKTLINLGYGVTRTRGNITITEPKT